MSSSSLSSQDLKTFSSIALACITRCFEVIYVLITMRKLQARPNQEQESTITIWKSFYQFVDKEGKGKEGLPALTLPHFSSL